MVTGIFGRYAKRDERDLSYLKYQDPIGITSAVRGSYEKIVAPPETAIGLRGFRFKQYGLSYEVYYKDPKGNDVPSFTVTCPPSEPYLHNSETMGVSEKAHALLVVNDLIGDLREGLKSHLYALERACFTEGTGKVLYGMTGIRKMPDGKKILAHIGLKFPDDIDYGDAPELHILRLEWIHATHHMAIDNTGIWPEFTKGRENSPNGLRFYMTRGEAKAALTYAKDYAAVFDSQLILLGNLTNFWNRAAEVAEWSSMVAKPVGP